MDGMHPSRLLHMQEPSEDGTHEASPQHQPVRRVTGSNSEPLGQQQHINSNSAHEQQLPGPSSSDSGLPDQPPSGPAAMAPAFAQDHTSDVSARIQPLSQQRPLPETPALWFQSLAQSNDAELLSYLAKRHITIGFLREIDSFLRSHPEIYDHAGPWTQKFNSLPPLAAYKHFLTGYVRPARYVPGWLPETQDFTLPQYFVPPRMDRAFDEELLEFFDIDGGSYRYDILREMDQVVDGLCYKIQCGIQVKNADRKLVAYAIWGNPVDAFKYYEYSYQTVWLKHKYLPEHVVLEEVPKTDNYTLPAPSVLGPDEGHRSHLFTRKRMAKAQDDGVDVLDVLMQDFTSELAKKGHRRDHISKLKRQAQKALDQERDDPQGYDIVDLVMDIADYQPRLSRPDSKDTGASYSAAEFTINGRAVDSNFSTFALPGGVTTETYASPGFVVKDNFKVEPSTPQSFKQQRGQTAGSKQQGKHPISLAARKRKVNCASARSSLSTARKQEELLINAGESQERIKQARRMRIAAERNLAGHLMSLNKNKKNLTTDEVNDLMKLAHFTHFHGKKTKELAAQGWNNPDYERLVTNLQHCDRLLS